MWLNGQPLGFHVGAYLPFELRAKGFRRSGVNRLVVRVDSRRKKYDIPPLAIRRSGAFEGGWWNYNGLLREVYLRRVDTFDFKRVVFQPSCAARAAPARVDVDVRRRERDIRAAGAPRSAARSAAGLRFRAKRVPGRGDTRFRARLRIAKPRLWWIERPASLHGPAEPARRRPRGAAVHVHTGIRSLRVSRLGRVQLNGRD